MRRTAVLVLPVLLFAVQCGDGDTQYTAREDDLLLEGALGEWSFEERGRIATLRLCEDKTVGYCSRPVEGTCARGEGVCHDIRGGGRSRDETISNSGGCDCWGGAGGVRVKAILEDDGGFAVLTGSMIGSRYETRSGPYAPPFSISLDGAVEGALYVGATWDGSTITVWGNLPKPADLDAGTRPRDAGVDASVDAGPKEDRVLSTKQPRVFKKTAGRVPTCGAP